MSNTREQNHEGIVAALQPCSVERFLLREAEQLRVEFHPSGPHLLQGDGGHPGGQDPWSVAGGSLLG